MLDLRVAGKLADHAAVPRADHKDVAHLRMHGHGHVGDHFMVNELILFGEHHVAVEREEAAEFRRFKHIDALEFAFAGIELVVHTDRELHIRCLRF